MISDFFAVRCFDYICLLNLEAFIIVFNLQFLVNLL